MIRSHKMSQGLNTIWTRVAVLLLAAAITVVLSISAGFHSQQILSCLVFVLVVFATLFFWPYRLAAAFIGIAALIWGRALTLHELVQSSELDIILFLVGMMVVIGVLKELGLFTWVIQLVLNMKKMNGYRFVLATVFISALMACVVGEVTSIVFMCTLIFQVCDTLKVRAFPFLMISVMATNIGSSGTMLGNPVGILLGYKAGFTFGDFIVWSFPVMLVALVLSLVFLLWWFRREISILTERFEARRKQGLGLGPLVRLPYRRSLAILAGMLTIIVLHDIIEQALGLDKNTVLILAPIFTSGILMIWRSNRARHYIENEVEWWTLLFFMMLFIVVGSLAQTGVTTKIANVFLNVAGSDIYILMPLIIALSAVGSALMDNLVFVAAFIPVVGELGATPLWWALLFGACFGGNITMIGSTANIVALGMLEKRYRTQIKFAEWMKVGVIVGLITCVVAWVALIVLSPHMPADTALDKEQIALNSKTEADQTDLSAPSKARRNGFAEEPEGGFRPPGNHIAVQCVIIKKQNN